MNINSLYYNWADQQWCACLPVAYFKLIYSKLLDCIQDRRLLQAGQNCQFSRKWVHKSIFSSSWFLFLMYGEKKIFFCMFNVHQKCFKYQIKVRRENTRMLHHLKNTTLQSSLCVWSDWKQKIKAEIKAVQNSWTMHNICSSVSFNCFGGGKLRKLDWKLKPSSSCRYLFENWVDLLKTK